MESGVGMSNSVVNLLNRDKSYHTKNGSGNINFKLNNNHLSNDYNDQNMLYMLSPLEQKVV